jgi:iron complex outermembrane receptor protein
MSRAHLPIAACALLLASTARAESSPEEPEPLEVVVLGARSSGRGTSVQKVDRERFRLLGASTVAEAVATLPSALDASNVRGERMLTLRGFSQRQLIVMIDGVPVTVPYDGQIDTGKLPLGVVEHVTVVKGAGSLLYGPNGLGGRSTFPRAGPGKGRGGACRRRGPHFRRRRPRS